MGMQDGRITSSQITASSSSKVQSSPSDARLGHNGGWMANLDQAGEYLQVDFGTNRTISQIATQGRSHGLGQWTITFSLQYSWINGVTWNDYLVDGQIKVVIRFKINELQSSETQG